jgi:type IV pilus assembly protein PilC
MGFKLDNIQDKENAVSTKNTLQQLLETEINWFGGSFTNKKKYNFYLELGVLLKAGITIKEAFHIIIENEKKENERKMFETILNDIISGKPLSKSLLDTKKFSEYEFYSIQIGEESGNLAKVVQQLAVFFEKKIEQRRVVVAALTYPVIILSTAILVVIFMLSYVVPMFQDIFKQNNVELPWITEFIIKLSSFVKSYLWIFILILVSFIFGFKYFKKNHYFKSFTDYFILKIPVFGKFINKVYLAQFTQAVSLLTNSKIPVLNSIQLVKKMIDFIPLREDLEKVEFGILQGNSLHESLKSCKMFDSRMIALVKVSEETNQTDFIFNQLNEQYSQEVSQQSKVMSTILEPFIILIVGLIVAVLLVAMYLPMFQLSSAIG